MFGLGPFFCQGVYFIVQWVSFVAYDTRGRCLTRGQQWCLGNPWLHLADALIISLFFLHGKDGYFLKQFMLSSLLNGTITVPYQGIYHGTFMLQAQLPNPLQATSAQYLDLKMSNGTFYNLQCLSAANAPARQGEDEWIFG